MKTRRLIISLLFGIFISLVAGTFLWRDLVAQARLGRFDQHKVFVDGVSLSPKEIAECQQSFVKYEYMSAIGQLVFLSLSAGLVATGITAILPGHFFVVQKHED